MAETDSIPMKDLEERYGISRSVLYVRLRALAIATEKVGNRAYISQEQLQQLDDLHAHIGAGGTVAAFIRSRFPDRDGGELPAENLAQAPDAAAMGAMAQALEAFAPLVRAAIAPQPQSAPPPANPLAYLDVLEKVRANRWLLSTRELAYLLARSDESIDDSGDRFEHRGFIFVRAQPDADGLTQWQVTKPDA
ncbi:MAG: hypothetical protein AAFY15_01915 [Cyanobacteria bacterium J06648_11]